MAAWLETETRALLQRDPPEKLAPPDTRAFSLVLLALHATDEQRLRRAIERGCCVSEEAARRILAPPMPVAVKRGLSYADAAIGQYELIACDAVSVIIPDGVVSNPPPGYLQDLYGLLLRSPEFELVRVRIVSLVPGPQTRDFLFHFFGRTECDLPIESEVMRKKARVMTHLGAKIGGRVVVRD
jgi:hypothetical protein